MLREEGRGGERRDKWDDCHSEIRHDVIRYGTVTDVSGGHSYILHSCCS